MTRRAPARGKLTLEELMDRELASLKRYVARLHAVAKAAHALKESLATTPMATLQANAWGDLAQELHELDTAFPSWRTHGGRR